jgi:hemolysin III
MLRRIQTHPLWQPERWHPERANQWTHAAGFLFSLIAGGLMLSAVWTTPDPLRIAGVAVYVFAMIALYAASTLSHSFEEGPHREFYRMLDQVCIFLFMAACFTPFALTHLRGPFGYMILAVMWGLAVTGSCIRVRGRSKTLPIALFIPLGWLPVLTIGRMYEVGQWSGLLLVLAGGLSYTGGFWFLANDHKRGWYHAAWHLSTISGTVFHYLFLWQYVAALSVTS